MSTKCREPDLRARVGRACAELDRRLRAGESVRAEDYFAADPALASDVDSALELIYAEFVTRLDLDRESSPGRDEWFARFPRWDKDLRDLFQIHEMMKEGVDQGLADGAGEDPEWDPACYPQRLRHCELLEEVGRGAMGVVYKARDLNLRRLVALKMIRPGALADDPHRFRAEAEAVARLQHPNIVQIYEIFEVAGRSFISLEFIDGGSLKQAMAGGPLRPREAAALMEVVARAIEYAHRRGVVHRDLKPANVLLTADGVPKVVDFGLAKLLTRNRTAPAAGSEPSASARRAAILGTLGYMAPEQFGAASDQDGLPADVFSLGAILYELLTGRSPCGIDAYLADVGRGADPAPTPPSRLRPEVPRDLDAICVKCLQADPARRYPDAGALADDLGRYLADKPVHARDNGAWVCAWKWMKRRPAGAALAAVVTLAVLGMLIGSFWYNARLAAMARWQEQLRAMAVKQARQIREQLDVSRRSLYALQLAHVESSLKSNPGLGLAMLKDERYCPEDLRDFTWGYFLRQCRRKRLDLRKHNLGLVHAVAVSPDGKVLAVAGGNSGGLAVAGWAAAPAGGGPPGKVTLFEMSTEERNLGTLAEGLGPVRGLSFSPDGRTLTTAGGAGSGVVRLWDVASRRERLALAADAHEALSASFRPDGLVVATAGGDGSVRLWDARTGLLQRELKGHEGAVRSLAFAPDGGTLATGGDDGLVRLWDPETGRSDCLPEVHPTPTPVHAVVFSPDGTLLARAGGDRITTLWDLAERRPRSLLTGHLAEVRAVAFSPDGSTLLTGGDDCIVRIWRTDDGREVTALNIHTAPVTSVAFAPGGDVFVSGSLDQTAKVWDLVPGRQCPPLRGHADKVNAAIFAPGESTLITAGKDRDVRLWDLAEGRVRATLQGIDSPVKCLALSRPDNLLASGSSDGLVRLWDLHGACEPRILQGHTDEVSAVAFTADGRYLASASLDATVRLWDPSTGRCRATFRAHEGGAHAVAFSPNGTILASAGEARVVRLWQVTHGTSLASLNGHTQGVVSLAFHPDGRTLATGAKDRTIKLWDMGTFKEQATLWGHNHWVCAIVFSPDGKTMASSTGDPGPNAVGEVKLWDAVTGHVRATFQGQTTPIAFSPDGRTFLTGNHDETINLLEVMAGFPPQ